MRRIDLRNICAASSGTLRDINQALILNLVRERQPISRADIARLTGLQRSTISAIVAKLIEDRWVREVGAGLSRGGRRPSMLELNAVERYLAGVNIGVRETTVALCDLNGRIDVQQTMPTGGPPEKFFLEIAHLVRRLWHPREHKGQLSGIGISAPGLVDIESGQVLFLPNLQWRDIPATQLVSEVVGVPTYIDNEANAAVAAELWLGEAHTRQLRDIVFVSVGAGLGTGIAFDGQVYRGQLGMAGEFGHMRLSDNAVPCSCGNYGCWEALASNQATVRRYRQRVPSASPHLTVDEVIEAARRGEAAAAETLAETGHYLGLGIGNLVVGLSPERVIIGGKICSAWDIIEPQIREAMTHNIQYGLGRTSVAPTSLQESPSLLGAISLPLARVFSVSATEPQFQPLAVG